MMSCHSAIERPYFFSMEGKYEAGPVLGHGGDCSLIATPSKWRSLDAWRRCSIVSSREPAAPARSASDVAEKLRGRETSSRESTALLFTRIEAVNPSPELLGDDIGGYER